MTSPNTETVEPFKREERYIVIKRKHLDGNKEHWLRTQLEHHGIDTVECVVVESDWPEYETVWRMIEARVTGAATPTQPLPADVEGLAAAIGEGLRQWTIEHNGGIITSGMKREMAECILRQPAFVALAAPTADAGVSREASPLSEADALIARVNELLPIYQAWPKDQHPRNGGSTEEWEPFHAANRARDELLEMLPRLLAFATRPATPAVSSEAKPREAKAIAAAVVQSACETDPADPEHPDTIMITCEDLESHIRMHVELADERAAPHQSGTHRAGGEVMGRESLPERIDMLLADAGGSMSFADLAVALWPDRDSHRYSSNGGPPGCYMALSAGLRRGGFAIGGTVGAGNRIVYARRNP